MTNFYKYCQKCGEEIPHDGMTMYEGKIICQCKEKKEITALENHSPRKTPGLDGNRGELTQSVGGVQNPQDNKGCGK